MRGLGIGVLLVALALGAAACGGGDQSDSLPDTVAELTSTTAPEGRALSDWQAASRSLCKELVPKVVQAVAAVQAQPTIQEAVEVLIDAQEMSLEYIDRLRAIPVPTERTNQVERVNDRLNRARKAIGSQLEDLREGQLASVNSQLGVLTNYADTDDLYESLDVPECVAPS